MVAEDSVCIFPGPEDNGILDQTDFPRKLGSSKPHKCHFSNINGKVISIPGPSLSLPN